MVLPDKIRIDDRSLEVHLGGPGFGEGVFLLIGKTVGIGIDCCSSFFQSRKGNESFIESKVEELPDDGALIWILTHFHYDHYHGLASLLTRLDDRIKEMVLPLDFTPGDLSYLQEQLRELESKVNVRLAHKHFEKLRNLITVPPFTNSVSRVQGVQSLSIGLTLGSDEIPLRVKICSSSTDVFDKQLAQAL